MQDAIYHPIHTKDIQEKFHIQKEILKNGNKLFEIRGERGSGKTDLMIKSFLFDFSSDLSKAEFSTFIISPNHRISEYFRTSIQNKLFHLYGEDSSVEMKKIEQIIKSKVLTLAEVNRGDKLKDMKISNVYIDPADFMSIWEIVNLVEICVLSNVKNMYFFRNC